MQAIITMIPAINIIVFSIAKPTFVIIMTIYSIFVGISDDFLKPIFLGKGLETAIIVIPLGTIHLLWE